MVESLLTTLKDWCEQVVATTGYPGIIALMAIGCACIPIPSEVVMVAAGIVAQKGGICFHAAAILGAFGCMIGSALSYWAGRKGGRPFLEKYGKYVLFRAHDFEVADRWFHKYGQGAVFLGRMVPVIRTFISLPAGIHGVSFWPFLALSLVGSLPWCYGLAYVGYRASEQWETVQRYMNRFETLIIVLILVGIVWFVYSHLRRRRRPAEEQG